MVKLVLVDRHELVRDCMRSRLENLADISVLHDAPHLDDLLRVLPDVEPDVAILNSPYPFTSACETFLRIREVRPDVKIVVLGSNEEATFARQLLRGGADSYVLTKAHFSDRIDAIEAVMDDRVYVSPDIAR